jgi:8-oxo-dGTP pyrophosphatase MutT (NUDIX family)
MQDAARIDALRARLAGRACEAAPPDRLLVVMAGGAVGSAAPAVASFLVAHVARFSLDGDRLLLDDADLDAPARTALLFEAALRLRDAGLVWGWRDEQLDVRPGPDAAPIARIERAACRALGITTIAVHLNAFAADGRMWVARRAKHKQIDPGKWDNLVGGMVPAGESEPEALRREATEEAGLDLAPLKLLRGGRVHVQRVVAEGFQSEIVQVFDATLPPDVALGNRDGEVAAIEARPIESVVAAIERDEFTLEAALVVLDTLTRQAQRG